MVSYFKINFEIRCSCSSRKIRPNKAKDVTPCYFFFSEEISNKLDLLLKKIVHHLGMKDKECFPGEQIIIQNRWLPFIGNWNM